MTDPAAEPADDAHETRVENALPPESRRADVAEDAADPALVADVPPAGVYEAKAGSYYRNVRYVIALALVAMGAWFMYDGLVTYPNANAQYERLEREAETARLEGREADRAAALDEQRNYEQHSAMDILLQRALGAILPPLAIALLVRWLYISRGRVRLDEQDVLHAPGHPPVPAASVTEIDDALWDRKGISRVTYDADGQRGTVKLDDFVYERKPIDQIHDRLVALKRDG